jgi:hypothetical protein
MRWRLGFPGRKPRRDPSFGCRLSTVMPPNASAAITLIPAAESIQRQQNKGLWLKQDYPH